MDFHLSLRLLPQTEDHGYGLAPASGYAQFYLSVLYFQENRFCGKLPHLRSCLILFIFFNENAF